MVDSQLDLFTTASFVSFTVDSANHSSYNVSYDTQKEVHSFSTHEYIIVICTPILVILGTLGNGLSALVLLRRRFRRQSTSVYLVALALSDSTFLFANSMTKNFIKLLFGVNYSTTHSHSCALYVYMLLVSKCLSAWFIVAVTSERLVVVSNPLSGRNLVTRRRAVIVVLAITLVVSLTYTFVLPSYVVRLEEDGKIGCAMRVASIAQHIDVILKVFDMVFYSVLPSVILFSCNVALVYKVVQSDRFRDRTSSTRVSTSARKQQLGQSRRLTLTLITLSWVYLIFTFPMTAFLSYVAIVNYVEHYQITFRSLYTLQMTNSAINFLLYASGPAFREELSKIFCTSCMKNDKGVSSLVVSPSIKSNWRPRRPNNLSLVLEAQKTETELLSPVSMISVC